jgi:preprotein translocase subunit SecG
MINIIMILIFVFVVNCLAHNIISYKSSFTLEQDNELWREEIKY